MEDRGDSSDRHLERSTWDLAGDEQNRRCKGDASTLGRNSRHSQFEPPGTSVRDVRFHTGRDYGPVCSTVTTREVDRVLDSW